MNEVAVVDPQLLLEVYANTEGDRVARMTRAVDLLSEGGVSYKTSHAALQRMQALAWLLSSNPDIERSYSDKALVIAAAKCELIEPPLNLIGGDEIAFDPDKFRKAAAVAEL